MHPPSGKKVVAVGAIAIALVGAIWGAIALVGQPRSYEECVLSQVHPEMREVAVGLVYAACSRRFREGDRTPALDDCILDRLDGESSNAAAAAIYGACEALHRPVRATSAPSAVASAPRPEAKPSGYQFDFSTLDDIPAQRRPEEHRSAASNPQSAPLATAKHDSGMMRSDDGLRITDEFPLALAFVLGPFMLVWGIGFYAARRMVKREPKGWLAWLLFVASWVTSAIWVTLAPTVDDVGVVREFVAALLGLIVAFWLANTWDARFARVRVATPTNLSTQGHPTEEGDR